MVMGEGLMRVARRHGGLTVRSGDQVARYDGEGRPVQTVRCTFDIEKEWPGHSRVVLSRRQCRNKTRHPSGRCWMHR